jgi:dynactin 1
VSEGTAKEKDFSEAIETLNEEMQALEIDVAKWRKAAEDRRAVGETDRAGQERAVATAREVGALKKEITSLKGAVTFFREENGRLRRSDQAAPNSWLLKPLRDPKTQEIREFETELAKEGRDVMAELCSLVLEERVVDLDKLCPHAGAERMKWKPQRETPRWTVARQRERYEAVRAWKQDLLGRVEGYVEPKRGRKEKGDGEEEVKREVAATVRVRAPRKQRRWAQGEVIVQAPESWEALRGRLGVVDA